MILDSQLYTKDRDLYHRHILNCSKKSSYIKLK